MTKVSRIPRHRSHHHQQHQRSNTVIHVTILSANNKSPNRHESLHSFSTSNNDHYLRDLSKKSLIHSTSAHSKSVLRSNNHTKIYPSGHSSSQSVRNSDFSMKKLETENSWSAKSSDNGKIHHGAVFKIEKHQSRLSKVALHKDMKIQSKDARTDSIGNTEVFHRVRKDSKKKRYTRRCIIACVLVASIVAIIVTIILLVLLIKPKSTKTPTNEVLLRWNSTGVTIAGGRGAGNGSDQLITPSDAKVDYQNSVYIADRGNQRIQKYTMLASYGTTVAGNGSIGSALNQLSTPSQVLVDPNGDLRITDTGNHKVKLWLNGALSGSTIAGAGGRGGSNDQLSTPYGIVHDIASDILYVADFGNHRIMRYLSGASSGSLVAGGNGAGNNATQLYGPVGIYLDSFSNSLLIVNNLGQNIVRWSLGATNRTVLAGDINGTYGNSSTMLRYPIDVTLDPMGNMYVADRNNHRIQLFLNGQTEGITIAGVTSNSGNSSVLLNQPWSVELDNQLNLYVADSLNHRIQKFVRY